MTTQLPDIDVIANPQPDMDAWRTLPRRLEAAGFHGVVCPDNPWSADPFQLMAIAASVTTTLHVGAHVLAAPLREPAEVADQTRSLATLSRSRFALGLGTGLPTIHEFAQRAGRPAMDGRASRSWIAASARAVRDADLPGAVPITVAAGGARSLALAAEVADEVALAIRPTATTDDVTRMVQRANSVAQQHDRKITFVVNPIGIGNRLVGFHDNGPSADELGAAGAFALLPEGRDDLMATLAAWRTDLGIGRIVVSEEISEQLESVLSAG